jgi:hypothetical protein
MDVVAYLRIIIPEEREWGFLARTWGHEINIAGARRDLGACLDDGRGRERCS